jgi:hypothetical protein
VSGRETRNILQVLNERVDVRHVTRETFGVYYGGLNSQQKIAAGVSIISGTATTLAAALEGTERVKVTRSEVSEGGLTFVYSTLTAPVEGLRDGLLVKWVVSRSFGSLKLVDVEVGGRSAILVQSDHIDQLFEISQGNLLAVLAGMSEFEQ